GMGSSRRRAILALAATCARHEWQLDVASQPEQSIGQLLQLPGVSDGTAQYLAMRALRWPDAFPEGDLVVRTKRGGLSAKQAQARCMAWRPWRRYAV
ncbi:adenosine deaminase, partial [Erwinia amylovora]|nr:adenosine deaminase [Erwinia amylovora]